MRNKRTPRLYLLGSEFAGELTNGDIAGNGIAGFCAGGLAHHEAVPCNAVGCVGDEGARDASTGREKIFNAERNKGAEGDVESRIPEIGLLGLGGFMDIDSEMDVADAVNRMESLEDIIVGNLVFPLDAA